MKNKIENILNDLGFSDFGNSKELLDYIFFNLNKINNKSEDNDIAFLFFAQWAIAKNYIDTHYYYSLTTKGKDLMEDLKKL